MIKVKEFYRFLIFSMMMLTPAAILAQSGVFFTRDGMIRFVSDAPLELIAAGSDELQGAIDVEKKTFAFTISNNSFEGFNSQLQQEHFYENYIETNRFPRSSFQGKIIEDIDMDSEAPQEVRAKGLLDIHGVEQERIIRSTIQIKENVLLLESVFTVPLNDHNIKIPRIVDQKIAETVEVTVKGTLYPR